MNSDSRTREILAGAVAYHTHFGWVRSHPDEPCAPILSARSAIRSAQTAGLSAVVLRDLYGNSAGTAAVLQPDYADITVHGGIFLNAEVGGINPHAVDTALSYGKGAKFVCLATDSAAHLARYHGISEESISSQPHRYIEALPGGKVSRELYEVLELIAAHNIILETGYLPPEQILTLVREAGRVGVDRIVVTHPSPPFIDMSVDDQVRAADLGAYIEYTWMFYTHHLDFKAVRYGRKPTSPLSLGRAYEEIRAVGAERCILSTDFGQLHQAEPEEGLRQFVYCLAELGLSDSDLRVMVKDNPEHLLS